MKGFHQQVDMCFTLIGSIMSILKIIKIVFRQLLKPAAGQLPYQREGQIFSGTARSLAGRRFLVAGRQNL